MSVVPVIVSHGGKRYNIELDTSGTGEVFKYQLYSLTGVEPERQKILVKGGQLKDETDLSTLNIKPNHKFMMMGTPSSDTLKTPTQKPVFLEDLTEEQRAKQMGVIPAGLQNLGNTCYMNSTLQALRFVPELQEELLRYKAPAMAEYGLGGANTDLTSALRDLYKQMGSTLTGFPPIAFLQTLRTAFPQFAQRTREGRFEQQDAEECWSQIVSQLRQNLKIQSGTAEAMATTSFVDKYFAGKTTSVLKCDEETPDELPVESEDTFLKLDCHISGTTNAMREGILAGLTEKIEKHSPTLDRGAMYTKTTRVTRLPKYLTCHFVRFYWKREINKKTKIMRKVTFPFELDATEFCSDELKLKLIPVRDKIRNLRKDAFDRERANKRARRNPAGAEDPIRTANRAGNSSVGTALAQMEEEQEAVTRALLSSEAPDWEKEISGLVDPEIVKDDGQNATGLYELLGVVTHQGASSDSGHYCSFVKKKGGDGKTWYFFNDDKVTEVTEVKVEGLAGGGESHSALICLYQAVPITSPVKEDA
ncbi:ubiquitin C-terminal hydrolase-like protein [Terfezia boudieri ATCC MYA-4762]|uniref:Ubiquitin carboxyl-terminal hydrolase n=1 Tax=Terfezia boudieri ATCC MYA-4762 TaxID=1051890 RepID=A0A3N4LWI3_9PEZI|nr:ubiquitin C-terminal hydrolase-like protein [Terfezia boudieri ATCC MYA-4762]